MQRAAQGAQLSRPWVSPPAPRLRPLRSRVSRVSLYCSAHWRDLGSAFDALRSAARRAKPSGSQAEQLCVAAGASASGAVLGDGGGGGAGGGGWGGSGGNGGEGPVSSSSGSPGANPLADLSSSDTSDLVEEVILIDVGGMKCGGCVSSVKDILEKQPGVSSVTVNLATETALVRVMVPRCKLASSSEGMAPYLKQLGEQLAQALTSRGFKSSMRDLTAGGASLAARVAARRQAKQEKLQDVTWKLAMAWALSALSAAGHLAHAWAGAPAWLHALHSTPIAAALSIAALLGPGRDIIASGAAALAHGRPDMNTLVGLGATASFGVSCVAAGLPALGWKTFFEEPAMLLGFVLIGRALEERAKLKASSDMSALQELVPSQARLLLRGGATQTVPCEAIGPGDVLVVLPGDRIPVDGVVVAGRTTVDESALTGEPLPLVKTPGSKVAAGTINVDGALQVRAERSGEHTAIADIVKLVEMAQARTAPIQRLADSISGKFAFGVMAASAATFAFWATAGTTVFPQVLTSMASSAAVCCKPAAGAVALTQAARLLLSAQLACNVLVTACPCALGLATPTAVLVGTAAGARRGLLIRGGDVLEVTSKVDVVVFDKTGTLTHGKPTVVQVLPLGSADGLRGEELLQLAAAVERSSSHPLAQALVAAAAAETGSQAASSSGGVGGGGGDGRSSSSPASRYEMEDGSFLQEPGSGVRGTVNGSTVAVGTLDWLQRQGVLLPAPLGDGGQQAADTVSQADQTVVAADTAKLQLGAPAPGHSRVYVGLGARVVGAVDVADALRQDARPTVQALQQLGIRSVLLSGDQAAAARAAADAVGIAPGNVYAGVKPAGKAALINELKAQGHTVAMVGDGINDTAALASAHVGMAMGGGVDAASEVAQVVLIRDQLHQVPDAIQLSRRTFDKIRQNLWWAFGYNLVAVPLAAGALLPTLGVCLTPSVSGALMGLSSVAVVANSLMLQLEVRGMKSAAPDSVMAPASAVGVASAAAATAGSEAAGKAGAQRNKRDDDSAVDRMEQGTSLPPKYT